MPKITAETATGTVEFECAEGRKLVLCLEDNGVDILHRCGGNAKCTTCRVEVVSGEVGAMGPAEQTILAMKDVSEENIRLSCQIRLASDVHVRVVNQASVKGIDAGTRPEE
jgi:ferredoxin